MKLSSEIKKNGHVLHSISIGEEKQTGQNYAEMVKLIIGNSNITKVTILKADTLQRFRIELLRNVPTKQAEEEAKCLGQVWEKENEALIEELKKYKECEIKKWDDYRLIEKFPTTYGLIESFYENDGEFRHDVNGASKNFLKKLQLNFDDSKKEIYALSLLKEYILEECTVLILMSQDIQSNYDYELYFGDRNIAMQRAYKKFVAASLRMVFNSILPDDRHMAKKASKVHLDKASTFFDFKKEVRMADAKNEHTNQSINFKIQQDAAQTLIFFNLELDKNDLIVLSKFLELFRQNKALCNIDVNTKANKIYLAFKVEIRVNNIGVLLDQIISLISMNDKSKMHEKTLYNETGKEIDETQLQHT